MTTLLAQLQEHNNALSLKLKQQEVLSSSTSETLSQEIFTLKNSHQMQVSELKVKHERILATLNNELDQSKNQISSLMSLIDT